MEQRDRGSATIWMVGLMAVVWMCATAVMVAGGVRGARHRAQMAADLAALAAATRQTWGYQDGCVEARRIAAAARARLDSCVLSPAAAGVGVIAEVSVAVSVSGPRWLGELNVPARARAGPADLAQSHPQ